MPIANRRSHQDLQRGILAVLLLGALLSLPVAHAVHSGSSPPPPSCGLVCAPKASLALDVSPLYANWLLANKPFALVYTVTNKSPQTLQGITAVTFKGQLLQDLDPQTVVTLTPGQIYVGSVWVNALPGGDAAFAAEFRAPFRCTGLIAAGDARCEGGQTYATADLFVAIPPDQDMDRMSDDLENTLLATYTPLMLYSQDHGQQEPYAPIDVVDYVRASSLTSSESGISSVANSKLKIAPTLILNPGPDLTELGGTIYSDKALSPLPRNLFLSPSSTAKSGSSWDLIRQRRNVGLYGHVTSVTLSQITDQDVAADLTMTFGDRIKSDQSLYKIEYWQFFGYSHDFELPSYAIPGLVFGFPAVCGFFVPACLLWPELAGLVGDPDTVADHDGDWCTVQLFIDPQESSPDKAILAIYHYAHGLRFGFPDIQAAASATGPKMPFPIANPLYDIEELQGKNHGAAVSLPRSGGAATQDFQNAQSNAVQLARDTTSHLYVHPVVYVEWGGHEFWPTSGWSLEGASKHGGDGGVGYSYFAAAPVNLGEIEFPMPGDAAQLITSFAGYWGKFGGFAYLNPPPQGPPMHRQWQWNPFAPPSAAQYRPATPPY
jgi:hypothetical protein